MNIEFFQRLERARTAPHPYLGVVHIYGIVPWGSRLKYYRRLFRLLHSQGLYWAWPEYTYCLKPARKTWPVDHNRAWVMAEAPLWLYDGTEEKKKRPEELYIQALRDSIKTSFGGQWPLLEG